MYCVRWSHDRDIDYAELDAEPKHFSQPSVPPRRYPSRYRGPYCSGGRELSLRRKPLATQDEAPAPPHGHAPPPPPSRQE